MILKFFRVCGLWPVKSRHRWLYYIYATVFHFIWTFSYISFKLANMFIETDLSDLTLGFAILLAEITLVGRIISLIANFEDILLCLTFVKKIQILDDNEERIYRKEMSLFSKLKLLCIILTSCGLLASWAAPFLSIERILPYPGWYPIEWKQNDLNYWIIFLFQLIGTAFGAYGMAFLQLFSIYWMVITGAQLSVLRYRFMNLGKSHKTAEKSGTELNECVQFHLEIIR